MKKEILKEDWEYHWDSIPDLIAHAEWHIKENDDPNDFHKSDLKILRYVQKYLTQALQDSSYEDSIYMIKCFLRKSDW